MWDRGQVIKEHLHIRGKTMQIIDVLEQSVADLLVCTEALPL